MQIMQKKQYELKNKNMQFGWPYFWLLFLFHSSKPYNSRFVQTLYFLSTDLDQPSSGDSWASSRRLSPCLAGSPPPGRRWTAAFGWRACNNTAS